ncbi:hypothetical protein [Legionella fallonii]|uniref:Secreted protein n=1 Tax=Legionella fallonii LLAP-10 TaxID=1212491 RepID=A0A098G226_9GAMM|nr:hypothetical protein [Legionella fallonii]CEG56532.1 conserved exported protein of unknown function [Legionella fallonii LLAP-10]
MRKKIRLFFLANICSLAAWNAYSAVDMTIVNTSDRAAEVAIGHHLCEETSTCNITPGKSIYITPELLQKMCSDTPTNCDITFGVEGIQTTIATCKYNIQEGIQYLARSRWLEYTARDLSHTVVEVFKRDKNS